MIGNWGGGQARGMGWPGQGTAFVVRPEMKSTSTARASSRLCFRMTRFKGGTFGTNT